MTSTLSTSVAIVAATLCSCGLNSQFAGLDMSTRRANVEEHLVSRELANGLRVVLVPDDRTNLVTVSLYFNVGVGDDPIDGSGLTHYIEHLIGAVPFQRSGGQRLRDTQLDGNASTDVDRTRLYAVTLDVDKDAAFEVAARRLEVACDALDDALLERERDVLVQEIRQRSRTPSAINSKPMLTAMWGAEHPYAKDRLGVGFVDVSRSVLCSFIETHYRPRSAVLVAVGNLEAQDMDRIRARFEHIKRSPAFPALGTERTPSLASSEHSQRVVVPGLRNPTVMILYEPPPSVLSEAMISLLHGAIWRLDSSESEHARTIVRGGRRARLVVAYAEAERTEDLPRVERALLSAFRQPKMAGYERRLEHARIAMFQKFDDSLAISDLAADVANITRPSLMTQLRELDSLVESQVRDVFSSTPPRVVLLLPDGGATLTAPIEVSTELHHIVPVDDEYADSEAGLRATTTPPATVEFRLKNGLRVLLSPSERDVSLQARLVIRTGSAAWASSLGKSAARHLRPGKSGAGGAEGVRRWNWYRRIGSVTTPMVTVNSTVFEAKGLSVYGDWHVWALSWLVVRGGYATTTFAQMAVPESLAAPSPVRVVMQRLVGVSLTRSATRISERDLEAFRQSAYRPDAGTLIVVGNFNVERMRQEIELLFGSWHGVGETPKLVAERPQPGLVLIPAASSETLELAVAFPLQGGGHVERTVLVEMIDTRLRVLREGMGVTYGLRASLVNNSLLIYGHVSLAFAGEAGRAISHALSVHADDTETVADFSRARRRVMAATLARPLGPTKHADQLQRIAESGDELDTLIREPDQLEGVTLNSVNAVAARSLGPGQAIAVVEGEESSGRALLRELSQDDIEVLWSAPVFGADRPPVSP